MSKAKKYRKKPVIVEAFRYEGRFNPSIPEWARQAIGNRVLCADCFGRLLVRTTRGDLIAHAGDYIVRGINGELYPVRADIFKKTYEEVEE